MHKSDHYKKLIDLITKASYKHSKWQVFSDFVEMSAISLSNAVDLVHKQEREKRYLEIMNSYEKKDQELFPEMFAHLVNALEFETTTSGPVDVLGSVFHELELHNKWKGQFFTPVHVCDAMGMITVGDKARFIEEKGFITVAEPCVGSGAMVLGFAKAMKANKMNYCSQMVVTATDIDLKCVHMAYIQLSLYGIPAVIIHGNTLAMQEWSKWYTPVYILNGWQWKRYQETAPADEGNTKIQLERSNSMNKVFGEFKSIESLNETAINLREAGENEEIFILGQENEIPKDTINKFVNGEIDYLTKTEKEMLIERKCRVCGCTEYNACEGGCYWVAEDLCSKCVENSSTEDETAIEKLKRELESEDKSNVPAEPIVKYLISKCENDSIFAERVKLKNKNLEECFNYVYQEVKKKLNGGSGWVDDNEVYKMAETYFILDKVDIEAKQPPRPKKEVSEVKKEEKKVKKITPKPKKKEVPQKLEKMEQITLFDYVR